MTTLDCFEHKFYFPLYKSGISKIVNFLDTTSDDKDLPRIVTKKWIDVYDQLEKNCNVNKEIRIKTSMLRSDLCDYSSAYIVVKGTIDVTKKYLLLILKHSIIQQLMQLLLILQMTVRLVKKSWFFKTMLHLSTAFQKLMA